MKKKIHFYSIVWGLGLILFTQSCKKEEPSSTKSNDLYFPKVKEIIKKNCTVSCHSPGLGFPQGLPIVLETDSDIVNHSTGIKSAIFGPFSMTIKQMPPTGSLSEADKGVIMEWLNRGGISTVCGLHK